MCVLVKCEVTNIYNDCATYDGHVPQNISDGIVTQHEVLTLWQETTRISWYCEWQNLGTQWFVNIASGSMCVHIQNKQLLFAKLNFTKSYH